MANKKHRKKALKSRQVKQKKKLAIENYCIDDHVLCAYCLTPLHFTKFTLDHFLPKAFFNCSPGHGERRLAHHNNNLVISCELCNEIKSDRQPEEFILTSRKKGILPDQPLQIYSIDKTLLLSIE